MKAKLLALFSLLALLLVSTAALADGRPTGIRIGRAVSNDHNVQIDVTITDTLTFYSPYNPYTVWIGNSLAGGPTYAWGRQYTSGWNSSLNTIGDPLPWAIDWGDGYYVGIALLTRDDGSAGWTATFSHTYASPGTYVVTAGDALACCGPDSGLVTIGPSHIYTGNVITGHTRYVWDDNGNFSNYTFASYNYFLAVTNTAVITTGAGIPTLNIYGLLAMAFVLFGAGLLVYRKPQQA